MTPEHKIRKWWNGLTSIEREQVAKDMGRDNPFEAWDLEWDKLTPLSQQCYIHMHYDRMFKTVRVMTDIDHKSYPNASTESLEVIRANEYASNDGGLITARFRAFWNEIVRQRAEIERLRQEAERYDSAITSRDLEIERLRGELRDSNRFMIQIGEHIIRMVTPARCPGCGCLLLGGTHAPNCVTVRAGGSAGVR